MTTKRMKSDQVRLQWRDVLDRVRHGETVIVEHYNRPIATIAPYEEPAVTTETDPISDRIQAYVAASALNLSDHDWARAAWGTRGPQGPAELRDINERLYGDVSTRAILIAESTGRDNHDPAVLAEVDMDAAWTAACASHITDWADTQIVTLREEDATGERLAGTTAMRNSAAKTAAEIEEDVRAYIHNGR